MGGLQKYSHKIRSLNYKIIQIQSNELITLFKVWKRQKIIMKDKYSAEKNVYITFGGLPWERGNSIELFNIALK